MVKSLRTKQRRKARMLKRTQMLAMEEGYSKERRGGGGSEQGRQFKSVYKMSCVVRSIRLN